MGAAAAVDDSNDEEVEEGAEALTDRQILVRAVAGMAGGLGICAAFSDPLVDALSELSQVGRKRQPQREGSVSAACAGCQVAQLSCNSAAQLPASDHFTQAAREQQESC